MKQLKTFKNKKQKHFKKLKLNNENLKKKKWPRGQWSNVLKVLGEKPECRISCPKLKAKYNRKSKVEFFKIIQKYQERGVEGHKKRSNKKK